VQLGRSAAAAAAAAGHQYTQKISTKRHSRAHWLVMGKKAKKQRQDSKKKAKKLAAAKAKTLENFMDSDEIIMDDNNESGT
jgi:tRNA(Met) C34 N-acetyltransferase TmcA